MAGHSLTYTNRELPIDDDEQIKIITFAYNKIYLRFSNSKRIVHSLKEDLFQIGYVEMYRIHREYGTAIKEFGTYALYCILREMAKEVMKEERHQNNRDDEYDITLIPDEVDRISILNETIFKDEEERMVLTLMVEGFTLREIAKKMQSRTQTIGSVVLNFKKRMVNGDE